MADTLNASSAGPGPSAQQYRTYVRKITGGNAGKQPRPTNGRKTTGNAGKQPRSTTAMKTSGNAGDWIKKRADGSKEWPIEVISDEEELDMRMKSARKNEMHWKAMCSAASINRDQTKKLLDHAMTILKDAEKERAEVAQKMKTVTLKEKQLEAQRDDLQRREDLAAGKTSLCVICMNAGATHACVPCGHQVMCGDCQPEFLAQDFWRCPTCRTPVDSCIRIYA